MNYARPISTMDDIVRIERLENGYEVEVLDPKIAESNAKPTGGYQDPYKAYAFDDIEKMLTFLREVLPKIDVPTSKDTYAAEFKKATSSTSKD
jgi:hypothetical protein